MRVLAVCAVVLLTIGCGDSQGPGPGGSGGSLDDKKAASTRQVFEKLSEALEKFRQDKGRYPTEEEGLKALMKVRVDADKKFSKPYTTVAGTVDAWGIKLYYKPIGDDGFELRSAGPDARLDTTDDVVLKK